MKPSSEPSNPYRPLAARYAHHRGQVDDLAQEAAIAAWRNPTHPHMAAKYKVLGLLYRPAPHRQLGGLTIRQHPMLPLHLVPDHVADYVAGEQLEYVELLADLQAAMDAMPKHLRAYVQRRYFSEPGKLAGSRSHSYEQQAITFLRERMSVSG